MIFLFDVDGTLTESRKKIDEDFSDYLSSFALMNQCYTVTGSDQVKTVEQIGETLYNDFSGHFQCSGNQFFCQDQLLYQNSWVVPEDVRRWLELRLEMSGFDIRTGNHIEERPGCINFSIVGRNATERERRRYVQYDKDFSERKVITRHFNKRFMDEGIVANIGGETGIDISQEGRDKSQVLRFFPDSSPIIFFADAAHEGGNDRPLAQALEETGQGLTHRVSGPEETWHILRKKYFF